ncbi:MAG TPA: response regulator [Chloroflexota bacterium]|nr:response regulator [Chloroflexota bacterium]
MLPIHAVWSRFGVPLLSTAIAAISSVAFYPILAATPSVMFTAAVAVSAWSGGFWPGLLSTFVGATIFDYVFVDSPYSLNIESPPSALYLAGFVGVEILITFLTATLKTDIARRNQAEAELRRVTSKLEIRAESAEASFRSASLLHEIGQAILGASDIKALADLLLDGAMRVGCFDLGMLRFARRDGALEVVAHRGFRDPENLPPIDPIPQVSLRVVQGRVPLIVEDVASAVDFPRMKREGVASLVTIPIMADDEVLGVQLVATRSKRSFGRVEVELLEAIANQAGIALQKARLNQESAEALSLLEGTLESTADGILVVDGDGRILRYNARFIEMWRLPESILETGSDAKAIAYVRDQIADPEAFETKVRDLYAHPENEGFDLIEMTDGRVFERYSRAHRAEGHRPFRVWSFRDVTERREIERRLLRAQRLETAGTIAGQVAHDFNNLLSPLMGYPELIKIQVPDDERLTQYCDTMLQAAEQMAQINEDLLALGRRGHFERVSTDINQLVREVIEQLGPLPSSLDVTLDLATDLSRIAGAPAQLVRMLANLIANAREAVQDIGAVTIRTTNLSVHEPLGRITRVPIGQFVLIEIADTGPGIAPAIRDRIFDPFFTTKPTGRRRGSGLGLSVVQGVVEDHGGYLDLVSEPGAGARFLIYLPAARAEAASQHRPASPVGGESLLVVDDDPFQLAVARELLKSLGYRVSVARNGEEAVELCAVESFDLLILDMVMPPGIDGTETFRRVRERYPDQRALLLSGFADSERVAEAQRLGAGAFVRKPVTREALAVAVRTELDDARHPDRSTRDNRAQ